MDEPTNGLDPQQIVEIRTLIQVIGKERTILLSSHILREVQMTCKRVLILNKGRLVASGTDLNEGDYDLRTGIHLAASEGHVEAVKFFIEHKANLSPKDRWGGTPLADALREKHTAVAALLKKHKAIE